MAPCKDRVKLLAAMGAATVVCACPVRAQPTTARHPEFQTDLAVSIASFDSITCKARSRQTAASPPPFSLTVDARTRILAAAADLLSRSLDAEISTREVCDAAGITVPVLYHHFGDKEGLLSAVVDLGWSRFLDSKRALLARAHADPLDDLRAGWDNHLAFARENPNFYRLMWSAGGVTSSGHFRSSVSRLSAASERAECYDVQRPRMGTKTVLPGSASPVTEKNAKKSLPAEVRPT